MTTVALLSRSINLGFTVPLLRAADPSLDLVLWPDPRFKDAEVAVCWDPPRGIYAEMPRLQLIHSIAAGVDNVVDAQDTRGLPVCRVVDPMLAEGMLQFVLWSVLHFHRQFDLVTRNQQAQVWQRPRQTPASTCRVGLMGLGQLGGRIAQVLPTLGYTVNGWSRSDKKIEGITSFTGDAALPDFLASTDVLVCLLPLTPRTRGILDRKLFEALPAGAAIVNCGRGEHLVVDDLVEALASGQLRGAVLDVFEQEPLPPEHALWHTPGVVVTPHMATMAAHAEMTLQIVRNIAQWRSGGALFNRIVSERGY